jgi:tetratricopeptide (TPR) repeat protein
VTLRTLFPANRRLFALVWLSLTVLPLAVVTASVTRLHRHHLSTLAVEWSARGERAYRDGRAAEAVDDFRSALMYARDDRGLRLRLARALVAAGHGAEARGYLLTLWEDEPGNGPVNLELGRLAAREGSVEQAIRYYHAAIEGAWEGEAERRRRESRLELVDYLVYAGESSRARPDLMALSADMPEDPETRKAIASLLARGGQSASAQAAYEQVLARLPNDTEALSGAGEAAFDSADYARAARYLTRAIARGAASPEIARDAAISQLVLSVDPLQRRLGVATRARRASRAFDAASTRLAACLSRQPESRYLNALSAEAGTLATHATAHALSRHPDDVETAMDLVFEIEIATARVCGEATGIDHALHLIALARRTER